MKTLRPYRPGHTGYVSDFTEFLHNYMTHRPYIEKDQQYGWYMLWDKHVDQKAIENEREDTVPVKPYSYE